MTPLSIDKATAPLTRQEAIAKAIDKNTEWGVHYVVVKRVDHPHHFGEDVFMVARESELRTLSAGSTVVFTTNSLSRWAPVAS